MYENETYEVILDRMLDRVSDQLDKRPSSLIYDTHSSTAIELQILYIELEYLIINSYGDTAGREFLRSEYYFIFCQPSPGCGVSDCRSSD